MQLLSSELSTQVLLENLQSRYFQDGSTRLFPKAAGANDPHQAFAAPAEGFTWVDVLSQASRQEQSFLLNRHDAAKGRASDTSA